MVQPLGDLGPRNLEDTKIPEPEPDPVPVNAPPLAGFQGSVGTVGRGSIVVQGLAGYQGEIVFAPQNGYQGTFVGASGSGGGRSLNSIDYDEGTRARQIDTMAFGFYRDLSDYRTYDFESAVSTDGGKYSASDFGRFLPMTYYDTWSVMPQPTFMAKFFEEPVGKNWKGELETNLPAACTFAYDPDVFFSQMTILRLFPIAGPLEPNLGRAFLQSGVFEIAIGGKPAVQVPLTSFSPINPYAEDPTAFFLVGPLIAYTTYDATFEMRFPRNRYIGPGGLYKVRLELVGLKAKRAIA